MVAVFSNALREPWKGPAVFCDFDGTITQADITDLILAQFADPEWRGIEQQWEGGLIGSRECLERQMALVRAPAAELRALIDSVPVDPDFAPFYSFLVGRGVSVHVLSDGFDYIVRRVLKRIALPRGLRDGVHVFASGLRIKGQQLVTSFPYAGGECSHGCATCKAAIMRRLGRGRDPVVFIGDGLSDRFAVEVADVIFAKGRLLDYCREHGLPCRSFESFADLRAELAGLRGAHDQSRGAERLKSGSKGEESPAFRPLT